MVQVQSSDSQRRLLHLESDPTALGEARSETRLPKSQVRCLRGFAESLLASPIAYLFRHYLVMVVVA